MSEIKECCQDQANRKVMEQQGDLTIERCTVCLCRHFTVTVDPAKMDMRRTT